MTMRFKEDMPFAALTRTLGVDELMKCDYSFHIESITGNSKLHVSSGPTETRQNTKV